MDVIFTTFGISRKCFSCCVLIVIGIVLLDAADAQRISDSNQQNANICDPYECPPASRKTKHSDPTSCTKYVECRGASEHELECPTGQTFDHDLRECTNGGVCQILCPLTTCGQTISCTLIQLEERNISYPGECTKYFQCRKSDLFIMDCPSGSMFDTDQSICKSPEEAVCATCQTNPTIPPNPTTAVRAVTAASSLTSSQPAPSPNEARETSIAPVINPSKDPDTMPSRADDQDTVTPTDTRQTDKPTGPVTDPDRTAAQQPEPTTGAAGDDPGTTPANNQDPVSSTSDTATVGFTGEPSAGGLQTTGTPRPVQTPPVHVIDPTERVPNIPKFTFPPFIFPTTPSTPPTTSESTARPTSEDVIASGPQDNEATTTPVSAQPDKSFRDTSTTAAAATPPTTEPTKQAPTTLTLSPTARDSTPRMVTSRAVPDQETPTEPVVTEPPEPALVHELTTSSEEFLEGDPATFQCHAILPAKVLEERNFPLPKPQAVWVLDGTTLTAGGRVSISTIDRFIREETISSKLNIRDLRPADSGLLQCIIESNKDVISEAELYLPVLGRPKVTLTLSLTLGVPGEEITAKCLTHVPATGSPNTPTNPPVYWFKDGVFLGMSENGKVFMGAMVEEEDHVQIREIPSGGSQLNIRVRSRMTLSCSAINAAGSSDIVSKVVNVVQPGEDSVYCEPEVVDGITWNRTLAGGELFHDCRPINAIGRIRRECVRTSNTSASWKNPDKTNCVTAEFVKPLRMIKDIEDSLGPVNTTVLTATANELVKLTRGSDVIQPGDLKTTVEIMERMTHIREGWAPEEPVPQEEAQAITETVSNLLNDNNLDSWENIEEADEYVSVSIMKTIDSYAEMLARTIPVGTERTITTRNVLIMLESMSKDNTVSVQFPMNSSQSTRQTWATGTKDYIMVHKDTVDAIKDDVKGDTLTVSGAYYNNLDKVLPTGGAAGVNSRVLAMTIHGLHTSTRLSPPVTMRFSLQKTYPTNMSNDCSFWNYTIPSRGAWSRVGCKAVTAEEGIITCECDHLTNFAMLVSTGPVSEKHFYILSMISLVGCIISMVALLLTMFFYASMWKAVKSHHAAVLINLCVALLGGNILFIAGVERTENKVVCTIIAALLHYFWLAAFFIMLVEGIQLLLYIIYVFHVRRKRDTAALLFGGWMFPAVIVGISLAITQLEGYGTEEVCWLSPESGLLWAFVAPVLCVILVNIVILMIVLKRALSAKIPTGKKKNKLRSAVWNILVITPLLGITWVLGVFSVNEDTIVFQYIFAVSNSLQGLFIFIFHALCNKKKGRYTLKGEAPSNQKKTQSGSGLKTTSADPQSRKSSKTSSLAGPVNGYAANGHPHRQTSRNDSSMTMDLHSPPTVQNGHTTNGALYAQVSQNGSKMAVDLHTDPTVQRTDSYSSGNRPTLHQQLSDGSDLGSEIVLPAPSPPSKALVLDKLDKAAARVSTVSTVPPSPTTTTTDVSWTSERDFERELSRTTSA